MIVFPFSNSEYGELILSLVVFPIIFDSLMFYINDTVLKYEDPEKILVDFWRENDDDQSEFGSTSGPDSDETSRLSIFDFKQDETESEKIINTMQ
jgi:hypothetical protein